MLKKVIAPKNLHRPFGYAHAIQIDNTLYISGQIPLDQEMKVVGKNDIATQTEWVYENLKKVVEDAGGTMTHIVMMNIYCTDIEAFDKETRHLRKKYFGDYYPAVTAVEVKRLYRPDFMIEIEAVAVLDSESKP
jgi:2-iminobutanoate/2-iminopropanoate deaminase